MTTRCDPGADSPLGPGTLELYWIPLGAGTPIVRASGRLYETIAAVAARRPRRDIYHSALIATVGEVPITIEMAPVPDHHGRDTRGAVAEGSVGSRLLGGWRIFRYEIRGWPNGKIPDLVHAVGSPVQLTRDPLVAARAVDLVPLVPTPVWGRDELHLGEMWNSNSVVSWVLAHVGLLDAADRPPRGGRAPGWDAGVVAAHQVRRPQRPIRSVP